MKYVLLLFCLIIIGSCIPVKSAPRIRNFKIVKGKQFEKGLPERNIFVFEDKQDVNAFYQFVDKKFQLGNKQVMDDVPFTVNKHQYFFSFYEVDKKSTTIDLFPFLVSRLTKSGEEDSPEIRQEDSYYIAIEAYSDLENDCLDITALSRTPVLNYLRQLKDEYQNLQEH